jgi:hypothetical protein
MKYSKFGERDVVILLSPLARLLVTSLIILMTGITRNDLVNGLRNCLGAASQFGPLCLRLILDKLTSTNEDTKVGLFAREVGRMRT